MTIVYHGRREHGPGPNVVLRVEPLTEPRALDPRLDVRNHSPTGLEWGYGGSGPAQLALALCIDALDGDVARARHIYQHVKWKHVVHFEREEWAITRDEIRATIEQIEYDLERKAEGVTDDEPPSLAKDQDDFAQRMEDAAALMDRIEQEPGCVGCGAPITTGELCATCAKGNDPFRTSKYAGDQRP